MNYAPHVRQITVAELEIVRDLALQIWPKCYRSIIAPDHVDSMLSALFDLDTLEQDITERGHVYWVIRVGHRDVGFASAHLEGTRVWLTKLYVLADYRGFGLGKRHGNRRSGLFRPRRPYVGVRAQGARRRRRLLPALGLFHRP